MKRKREQDFISELLKTKLEMVFCGLFGKDKEKPGPILFDIVVPGLLKTRLLEAGQSGIVQVNCPQNTP